MIGGENPTNRNEDLSLTVKMLGCCASRNSAKQTNKRINKELKRERNAESKLLLLGAGDAGKSMIIKQIKIIFDKHVYTTEECIGFKPIIFSNTIESMHAILSAMNQLKISFDDPLRQRDAELFLAYVKLEHNQEALPPDIGQAMQSLWNDHAVQTYFLHARDYYWSDSAAYYLNSLDRLLQLDYIPTQQDILRSRDRTTGIVHSTFILKNHRFRIIDVTGQGGERRKWTHCFDDMRAVIFVSALSDYDIVLSEDDSTNRMLESLQMFKSICHHPDFRQAAIILFLNKKDLFEEKLRFSSINVCFPDYKGPNTYESSVQYIQEQFQSMYLQEKINSRQRDLYTHITCAVDTEAMQPVFIAISDIIIQMNLNHKRIF